MAFLHFLVDILFVHVCGVQADCFVLEWLKCLFNYYFGVTNVPLMYFSVSQVVL